MGIHIEPLTPDIAERAARLRAHHAALRLPDALVLATADALDAIAFTCDRAWPRVNRRASRLLEDQLLQRAGSSNTAPSPCPLPRWGRGIEDRVRIELAFAPSGG